jgi:arylsulfatase A-like enzyme
VGVWRAAAFVVLLLNIVACSPSSPPPAERLRDVPAAGNFVWTAAGTQRRVLNPFRAEHVFNIPVVTRGTRLLFSPGIKSAGPVVFEVIWNNGADPPKTLYRGELTAPGWLDDEVVALPSDTPGELRLRKTIPAGSPALLHEAGWGDPTVLSGSASEHTSVILISLDTVRADRLGIHGRREARTPVLDALGRDGIRYEQAYSSSTWTRPSHQSLLFSIHPAALAATAANEDVPLGGGLEGFASLAGAFSHAGYLTAAFTGGGFVSAGYGLGQGFDTYFMYRRGQNRPDTCDPARFDGAEVFARAARWLRHRAGLPFFLFVHTYEPHDRCPVARAAGRPRADWARASPEIRDALISYYDDMVARSDALVGGLLRELDTIGLADSTVVVVTSDHGEALWEHGFAGHGCGLPPYEEVSRVPLILRLPKSTRRSARIDAPVSTIDLAPTVLALTGVPIPATMQGGVLPGLGLRSDADKPVYVHCGDWLSVRQGDDKLMVSPKRKSRMLFNSLDDPAEHINLVRRRRPAKRALRRLAGEYWLAARKTARANASTPMSEDIEPADAERLRALGYIE